MTMARMTLDQLVKQLGAAYGPRLASVVLYGSAASGEQIPDRSDYNVLVLLDRIEAALLETAAPIARAWREAGNPPPMTMTVNEWQRSSDVFPMEYADILDRHKMLHGEAPFAGIVVAPTDLRLQLEQQVFGKLLQLRQGVLLAGSDAKRQTELLSGSVSTVLVLCRAVLRLHGEQPSGDGAAVATRVGTIAGFDPTPVVRAWKQARSKGGAMSDAGTVLGQYLAVLERLNMYLDQYPA